MRRRVGAAVVVFLLATLLGMALKPLVSARDDDDDDGQGAGQSDHALLDFNAGEHVYCGVGRGLEPWTLHVTASAGGTPALLTIRFRDQSTLGCPIPANTSFSLTQSMGGVPEVDDLVRIDLTGSGGAMVSVRARGDARDPFREASPNPPEKDNFCINIPAEQPANAVTVTLGGSIAAFDAAPANGKLD